MPEFHPSSEASPLDVAARSSGICDRILVGLVLITLVRTSEALAGDQASIANAELKTGAGNLRQSAQRMTAMAPSPGFFVAPAATDAPAFSATEFRPRKHTLFDRDPAVGAFADAPMLRGTTVWQRMEEYKSRDGVRLLTLWESSGSTVSLQAGKRGDPSLQWTSRTLNRGGSTHGLLDRWFSVSLAHAGEGFHRSSRPTKLPAEAKPAGVPMIAGLK